MARNFAKASSQYLSIASGVVTGEPFSFSCWFLQTAAQTQEGTIFSVGITGGTDHHSLETSTTSTVRARTRNSSGSLSATTSTTFTDDVWNHGCGVWSASNSRAAYLNGGGKGTDSNNRVITGFDTTRIGLQANGSARHWDGYVAEVALWNVALTDAEVLLLSKGVSPLMVRSADLVAYWPLIGRYSPEIDPVGGNSLTLNAGPTQADHPKVFYPATPNVIAFAQPMGGSAIAPIAAYYARRRRI